MVQLTIDTKIYLFIYLHGQMFTKVRILLTYAVFSHGQLYVEFSRAKIENQTMCTSNVVYHEIFA
jgi:hypothetical protein